MKHPSFDSIKPPTFTVRGLAFTRHSDGSVEVSGGGIAVPVVLEPLDWASVMAHMSAGGGTSESFGAAKFLHGLAS